jgi:hypothetical protein
MPITENSPLVLDKSAKGVYNQIIPNKYEKYEYGG